MTLDQGDVARVFREEYGRAVAVLVRLLGDIDLAEEAVQEAFEAAVRRWPEAGLPPSPAGWIVTTARNRAIDRHRRESSRDSRHAEAAALHVPDAPEEEGVVRDDRLRLIFTCCHPALATPAQVALTLRLLGASRRPRSPACSSSPSRRSRSGWSGPRTRSGRRGSRTAFRTRPTCPTGCRPSSRCST
jgi:RNA polymerase sigma-70 factor (ECF subfamily)